MDLLVERVTEDRNIKGLIHVCDIINLFFIFK